MHPEEAAGGGSAGEQYIQTMFMRADFSDSDIRYARNYSVYASVLAYWYLVKYFWLLLPFYGTIKETAVISYGKTKKVQNQTYG